MKKLIAFMMMFVLATAVAAGDMNVDKSHTNVGFQVTYMIITKVNGRFNDYDVKLTFDPDKLETFNLEATIKVTSVDTENEKRDNHLRSEDFFETEKYPLMIFKSSKVSYGGANKYLVYGTLTIKDVSRDIVLEFVFHGQKENPLKKGQVVAGLDARLTLDRLEFNVGDGKFYKIGLVDKDVDILITLEILK